MRTVRPIPFPVYSRAERLADYAIHALGIAAAAIAVPALSSIMPATGRRGSALRFTASGCSRC